MPVAVKPIKPSKLLVPGMYAALEAEAKKAADDLELEFMLSTATWEHEVKFEKLVQVGPKSVEILVDTDDEIYRYVNEGTRPHRIEPKGDYPLAFPSVFRPKSQPGRQASGKGYSGGPTVYARGVNHPGTQARKFDKTIMKTFTPKFRRRMEKAMTDAAKASGHEMEK
jgi:hypothetical protein